MNKKKILAEKLLKFLKSKYILPMGAIYNNINKRLEKDKKTKY